MRTVTPVVYLSAAALLIAGSDGTEPPTGPSLEPPDLPQGAFQVSPATASPR